MFNCNFKKTHFSKILIQPNISDAKLGWVNKELDSAVDFISQSKYLLLWNNTYLNKKSQATMSSTKQL